MTIIEAINEIDALKQNTYTQLDKVKWLSRLDWIVKNEIIDTHEGAEGITFNGYTDDTDVGTELLIQSPYDEVYIRWMEMQIDYANGEYNKYNNSMQMFQSAYSSYYNYYNRTHMPLGKSLKIF